MWQRSQLRRMHVVDILAVAAQQHVDEKRHQTLGCVRYFVELLHSVTSVTRVCNVLVDFVADACSHNQ